MTSLDQNQNFWNSTEDYDEYGIDMLTDGSFCSVKWDDLWSKYSPGVHYPLLLFISIVGCVTNVLNLFIFTRSEMKNPTNLLLSVLAVTDFLCVFRKAVGVSMKFYRKGGDQRTSYQKHVEDWIHEICFYLFHTWSIYMTVAVALWRLLGMLRPMQSRYWFSYRRATFTAAIFVGFATLLVPLLFVGSSLELLNSEAHQSHRTNDSNLEVLFDDSGYDGNKSTIDDPDYVLTQTVFGERLQFWIHGLLVKLVPCFILIVCTILLIMSLRVAVNNRLALFEHQNVKTANESNAKNPDQARTNNPHGNASIAIKTAPKTDACPTVTLETNGKRSSAPSSVTTEYIKTTKMLIILLILFLVTELPPGILAFCVGLIDSRKFFLQCYMPIRPFLNLNEYISSSVGFFIYFYMSSKFRQTFIQQFCMWNRKNHVHPTFFSILLPTLRLFSSKGGQEPINITNKNKSPAARPGLPMSADRVNTDAKFEFLPPYDTKRY